jgi:hypothetical protein
MGKDLLGDDVLFNRISELSRVLRPAVADLGDAEVRKFDDALGVLRANIQQRRATVLEASPK